MSIRVNLRHSPGTPATSEVGGEAEAVGRKAGVGLECRLLGDKRTYRKLSAWPRQVFPGDAAFASPEIYEYLEAEGFLYAIRLPNNQILQESIG